jgi:hypothetical protein
MWVRAVPVEITKNSAISGTDLSESRKSNISNSRSVSDSDIKFAFVQFISGVMAQGAPPRSDRDILASSIDLQLDPEIKKIRETAKERMIELLLEVIQEGKDQGIIQADISDEAFVIYFNAFMDMFIDPQLQHRFFANPGLVTELGGFMVNGLRKSP